MSFRGLIPCELWHLPCRSPLKPGLDSPAPYLQPFARSTRSYPSPASRAPHRCLSSSTHKLNEAQDQDNRSVHSNNKSNDERKAKADFFRKRAAQLKGFREIKDQIARESTSELEHLLRTQPVERPDIRNTTRILRELLYERQIQPTARHYTALILANADRERGSPATVRNLLDEMEDHGIPADSATLHAALRVRYILSYKRNGWNKSYELTAVFDSRRSQYIQTTSSDRTSCANFENDGCFSVQKAGTSWSVA